MKKWNFFCRNRIFQGKKLFYLFLLLLPLFAFADLNSVAFYYGDHPPIDQLHAYQVVVFQPSAELNPNTYRTPSSEPFAYVSVGEVSADDTHLKQIPKSWLIGKNTIWKSKVIDQSNPDWQKFFINNKITPLWDKGYRGFFLDTLDSYQLAAKDEAAQIKQVQGLIALIKAIKTRYPDAKLILNRGFELLPEVHDLVYAVAAESLFGSWDQKNKRYTQVPANERAQLLEQLQKVKAMGLPVIVIDYVSPKDIAAAKLDAKKITDLGFIPWITNGDLNEIIEQNNDVVLGKIIPRQVLVIYSTRETLELSKNMMVQMLGMPLEYLGYVPIWQDVSKGSPKLKSGNYAGIIIWIEEQPENPILLQNWVKKQMANGVPVIYFGQIASPLEAETYLQSLGITFARVSQNSRQNLQITKQDDMIGFEIKPVLNPYDFTPVRVSPGRVLLQLKNGVGETEDAIALTPWGGYALSPYMYVETSDESIFWIINPFKFLTAALRKKDMPVPDTTTENGRRLMMVHVDGDGFSQKAEWIDGGFAAEVLKKRILNKYRVPTTVSVIEGEIAPNGIHPESSPQLMNIAREIFVLPWVEMASHTFSHPYDWFKIQAPQKGGIYNIPIPNYKFNINREVTGSVDFINKELAPPGKTCKVFLWSGGGNPDAQAVALTYKDGLYNYNGGRTVITRQNPSIINISPLGINIGGNFQTFAQVQNENLYTNNWTGPFYGYKDVIQTFEMTNSPYRFKPIDVYYHFYSAAKLASLDALETVYNWALKQPVLNIYISEYVKKALDFNKIIIANYNGGWSFRGDGNLRELRAPKSLGYPDLVKSENLVGYSRYGKDYYLHLGPAKQSLIYFTHQVPTLPYLSNANGVVTYFNRGENKFELGLKSHLPLEFVLANTKNCKISADSPIHLINQSEDGLLTYKTNKDNCVITVTC